MANTKKEDNTIVTPDEGKENTGTTPEAGTATGATPEATTPEKEEMVEVLIPKQGRGDTERFVAVNGERILVQTGKRVKVPKRFAEVILNSQEMSAIAEAYIENNISTDK